MKQLRGMECSIRWLLLQGRNWNAKLQKLQSLQSVGLIKAAAMRNEIGVDLRNEANEPLLLRGAEAGE